MPLPTSLRLIRPAFAAPNAERNLYKVQMLLGQHDPKVTMYYAHLLPGH
ncbi:hypothetical protein [Polaromonas vacuolata]|nr:hypothetical protein [Polaromonas vacuolata]